MFGGKLMSNLIEGVVERLVRSFLSLAGGRFSLHVPSVGFAFTLLSFLYLLFSWSTSRIVHIH